MRFHRLAVLAILLMTFITPARAYAKGFSERPLWTGVGIAGGGTAGDVGGAGALHLTLGLRLIPVVPELTVREGLASGPARHVTSIAAGARILLPRLAILRGFVRIGFSHQHELVWSSFKAAPGQALLGVADDINHRSGFETGGGIEVSLGPKGIFGLWVQGTAIVLPGTPGPPLTVLAEGGVSLAFGPRRGG